MKEKEGKWGWKQGKERCYSGSRGSCCHLAVSDSLRPHRLQHTRLPCPSTSPRICSDMTEQLNFDFSLLCIGEGNGNPLQYSCLENPRDGRAWWAAVYGVAQSRTRLKQLSSSMSIELMMPSNHFILCLPLLFLPSIFPSIRVFSNECALHVRWPKY